MRAPSRLTALAVSALAALAGCKARPIPGTPGDVVTVPTGDPTGGGGGPVATIAVARCTQCHGTPGLDASGGDPLAAVAPPRDLTGSTVGGAVGAHRAHLLPGPFSNGVECASCHLVPTETLPNHLPQARGKVTFSRLATATWGTTARLQPTWNPTAGACAGVYCHGAFKNGPNAGNGLQVAWNETVACGDCHGLPPPLPHPTRTDCGTCHGAGYTATAVSAPLHVNGVVELPGMTCASCHGDPGRVAVSTAGALDATGGVLALAAPPRDTQGNTVSAAVGAHLAHVNQGDGAGPGPLSSAIACSTCHPVPTQKAHAGNGVQVTFTGLAVSGGATPSAYDFTSHGCASTYCHGSFPGGNGASPLAWSAAGKLGCGACHGAPPPVAATHHPPNGTCGACHTGYTATSVSAATHVDGVVQLRNPGGCTQCHGDVTVANVARGDVRAAPGGDASALDAHGDPATATNVRGVGAHAAHLTGTRFRGTPVACEECHVVPAAGDKAHADGVATLTWGTLATASWTGTAVAPAWNGATCSNTYCHGNFKNGLAAAPTWTAAGSVGCGDCHGVSTDNGPGGTHPTGVGTTCSTCHGGAYTSSYADPTLHLNGQLDLPAVTCAGCHGDGSRAAVASAQTLDRDGNPLVWAAPPRDTHGATVSTAVGAHLAHVNQGDGAAPGPLSLAVACGACHTVPTTSFHSNGTVGVSFSGLATTGGASPAPYDLTGHTCASTYCHGAFTGGLGANAVSWAAPGKLGCASCHLSPPPLGASSHHPQNAACSTCHPGYGPSAVNAATHVDGTVQHTPASGCTQCHGDLTVNGVASGDVRAAPGGDANAVDSHGNPATATATRGVGAHAKHLTGTTWRRTSVACAECHAVPAAGDVSHASAANATVTWGTLATTSWAGGAVTTATWNGSTCANTYCHGNFKNGANTPPTWTAAGSVACGSCHAVSTNDGPGGNHPTGVGTNCASCHGGVYTNTTVDLDLHLNGTLDLPNMGCASCHGDSSRTAVATAGTLDARGGVLVKAAPPRDLAGTTVSPAVGAHLAHVNQGDTATPGPLSKAVACATCHPVPTQLVHSSGVVDVTFTSLAVVAGATPSPYNFTTHSCASTYCHGSFAGGNGANAIAWTATGKLACNACHGAPPAVAATHHPPNASCGQCHAGYTGTGVSAPIHVDGLVQHAPASGCTQCHGDVTASAVANTDIRVAPAGDAAAIDASGNPSTATGAHGVGAHAKHLFSTRFRATPFACGDCHALPATGDVSHANGVADVPFGALARSVIANGAAPSPAYASNSCSGVYCHGAFKNGANAGAGATVTWAAATPTAMVCGSCHGVSPTNGPGGTHPDITGTDCNFCHGAGYSAVGAGSVNLTLHLNGQLDGGGEPAAPGNSCGGCHTAIVNGMTLGSPVSRHLLGSDDPTPSGVSWVTTLSLVTVPNRTCTSMCHGDHPHDATSPVTTTHQNNVYVDASTQTSRAEASATRIAAGGSGTQNRDSTDYRSGAANGGMCLSCHQRPVDASRPAIGIAAFDASAHDFTFSTVNGTRVTWQYALHSGNFDRNCTKCHASSEEGNTPTDAASGSGNRSVHFGDNAFLLAGKKSPAGAAAGFVCYNCHGNTASPGTSVQGNRSGKNIQATIDPTLGHTYIHPSNADTRHDSAAEFNAAAFGNALGVSAGAGQRHASCMDCHDTHEAKAGTHAQGTNVAGPPLQGAWGVRFGGTLASWATPTAANFTKVTIVAGTEPEATLCLKCHSAYYGTLPSSPSGGFQETDQAMEFNPANPAFHPVLGSSSATVGNTGNVIAPWTRTSLMTCTDCHESDTTTDPNGPHGSASRFMLKGPNTIWNNTIATTSTGMPAGTFCANCHNASFSGSRFTQHASRSDHRIACAKCHAMIPHGGRRPGFLVNGIGTSGSCVPVNGVIAGWDQTAPYFAGGTGNLLCIKSYPANNTTAWGQGNCGCNGSSH
jgi:predicted CxxxxCH...CXXCH cytochrome family protein